MVLPTGAISFAQINVEVGNAADAAISLNDTKVRQVANIGSGPISIDDLRGKSYFTVSGGTGSVSGSANRVGTGSVTATTTAASVGTISGGQAPITYLWEHVSGVTAVVNSSTSASTTFSRAGVVTIGQTVTYDGVYRCKLTDANGVVIYGPACTVSTTHVEIT